jgi:hypothetical protein
MPPMKAQSTHHFWFLFEARKVPMVWIESLATAA